MKKILLIEDNDFIIKGLRYLLEQNNYSVGVSKTLSEGTIMLNENFDLVILDIMMPDGDGLNFYKKIIKNQPTIILTAKDDENIVVDAIDSGVDDYIVKPFRPNELLSRINKVFRKINEESIISTHNIVINLNTNQVFVDEQEINFTRLEYKILVLLFTNINRVVTRDVIIDYIWDITGKFVNDNTLSVYIKRIRQKLNNENIITTIKGIGYRVMR